MEYKNVLVCGGTLQMGKYVVEALLKKGYNVTIANRGKHPDNFGNKVERIIFDRSNEKSIAQAFDGKEYDAVIDTIAFSGEMVNQLYRHLKVKKYIQFSSAAAYPCLDMLLKETAFNPFSFDPSLYCENSSYLTLGDFKYQLGKRSAEKAAVEKFSNFVLIRIPLVFGVDSLSTTLQQFTAAVAKGTELRLEKHKLGKKYAVTHTSEPGYFAVHALEKDLTGIYNVASNGYVTDEMIIRYLEAKLNKKAVIEWGNRHECFHSDSPEFTLDTSKAQQSGYNFKNVNDWLWKTLDEFTKPYIQVVAPSLLPAIASLTCRLSAATSYGGDFFEYFKDNNITEFDALVENEAIEFLPNFLNNLKRLPDKIYGLSKEKMNIKVQSNNIVIYPMTSMSKLESKRHIILFCNYSYKVYSALIKFNYHILAFSELIDYTLYKNSIIENSKAYLKSKNVKYMFTKFPQANRIKNQTKLERFLGNNSIYGFTNRSIEYGLNVEDVIETPIMKIYEKNGIQKLADISGKKINVVNGFRVTTDVPQITGRKIYIFGSSVVYGVFADDSHTISSGLQRQLNEYFGENNEYEVVNASNYAGNDTKAVSPLLKALPIEQGDICIFNMDFPKLLVENCEDIIDLSPFFNRPHDYGEIFVDINHMTGNGYCAQGKVLFNLLKEKGYFDNTTKITQEHEYFFEDENTNLLSTEETKEISAYIHKLLPYRKKIGSIVMNCNPFTLGHRYLIEYAASKVDQLFIFVVEEDKSVFPFKDRFELVKQGTADIENAIVVPSGKFIISLRTFAAYSNKSELQDQIIDPSMDVEIFGKYIAPKLGINIRFAGDEPLDNVTRQYNDTMKRILPKYGVDFEIIKRIENGNEVISASRVRRLLETKQFDEIAKIVPQTTLLYLEEKYR